ncbi:hypothetical protein [Faecalispora jeddahensis]|uniref:hypothetical protein n=1 Tax=Faecalispora jeddahensis TaxID=1414721 RepID=UPI0018999791|nr:hypothetical protein [Faecalispora jeddahensis]
MQKITKTESADSVPAKMPFCTDTRKIGNTTFLVSSRFKEGQDGDIISTFARLVQYDADKPDKG